MTRIFVYGSLKRGYALHHLVARQKVIGVASTMPLYRIFDLGDYPGLIEWPEGLSIDGEVYDVEMDCLRKLDDVEGVNEGCYARRAIFLQPPFDGQTVHAWFWLGSISGLRDCGNSWP